MMNKYGKTDPLAAGGSSGVFFSLPKEATDSCTWGRPSAPRSPPAPPAPPPTHIPHIPPPQVELYFDYM